MGSIGLLTLNHLNSYSLLFLTQLYFRVKYAKLEKIQAEKVQVDFRKKIYRLGAWKYRKKPFVLTLTLSGVPLDIYNSHLIMSKVSLFIKCRQRGS